MDPLVDFSDKIVLITGGSRGLGHAMAHAFADRGATLIVVSRSAEACDRVAEQLARKGARAMGIACHVGHWDQIEHMVDEVYGRFGKVDVLVNNAGMSPRYPSLVEVTEDLFDKVVSLNLKGPFRLSALIGKRMFDGDGGNIINISSIASLHPTPDAEPYGAAKAGLNAITRSFAFAYAPKVRVNAIIAGPFLTDVAKAWDMDAFETQARMSIALGRGGQPEEIVGAALYLASASSSFTTGALVRVDGGACRT